MVDLLKILPEYSRPILEFQEIMKSDGIAMDEVETLMRKVRDNFYIQTVDESALEEEERQFSIVAKPGETLDYRKQRLLLKYNTVAPFTIHFLRKRLTELFEDDYVLKSDPEHCKLTISVTSQKYGAVNLLYDLLWDIVPAHLEIIANQQVENNLNAGLYMAGTMSGTFVQTI